MPPVGVALAETHALRAWPCGDGCYRPGEGGGRAGGGARVAAPGLRSIPGEMIKDMPRSDEVGTAAAGRGFLVRYRVMALTTATLLVILVFVAVPLQIFDHRPAMANAIGTIHGFLYVVYLVVAFQLSRRLRVPLWQLALILLAGTIPFCAFVAERKLTHRYDALATGTGSTAGPDLDRSMAARAARARTRWLSPRAVLLHLEVAVLAPGCLVAGWWQATRALAGNGLSWFYSIEWPVFAVVAVYGWWYLVHEDPDVYRARKQGDGAGTPGTAGSGTLAAPLRRLTVGRTTAQMATVLAVLVGLELAVGVAAIALVPPGRPSGWEPTKGLAVYLVHAVLGGPVAVGAGLLLARTRGGSRIARISGSTGAVGVALACVGGLLTGSHPLRLAGMGLMLLGTVVAGFGYLLPGLERMERSAGT